MESYFQTYFNSFQYLITYHSLIIMYILFPLKLTRFSCIANFPYFLEKTSTHECSRIIHSIIHEKHKFLNIYIILLDKLLCTILTNKKLRTSDSILFQQNVVKYIFSIKSINVIKYVKDTIAASKLITFCLRSR